MKNAAIKTLASGQAFLNFFNSKEVYSTQCFDTRRKAVNYAKKYGYALHETLPAHIDTTANVD